MQLMCHFELSKQAWNEMYYFSVNQDFDQYFAKELLELKKLEADALIYNCDNSLQVTPIGRLLIRNIAAVFDTYLHRKKSATMSRSI